MFRPMLALALSLTAGVAQPSENSTPVVLTPGLDQIELAGHIAEWVDDAGQQPFDEVRSPAFAANFIAAPKTVFSHAFSPDKAFWYRLRLRGADTPQASGGDWVLEVKKGSLDYVDFHVVRAEGSVQTVLTGDRRQAPAEQLDFRSFAIPLHVAANESLTVYIRVAGQGSIQVPIALWSGSAFWSQAVSDTLVYGMFFGSVLVMVFYNLLIFVWIRNRAYLYYVLYILSCGWLAMVASGHLRQYGNSLAEWAPAWINTSTPLSGILTGFAGILFMREFLQTRRHLPRADRALFALMLLLGLVALLNPVIPYSWAMRSFNYLLPATIVSLLVCALYLSLKGQRSARFYLLAIGVIMVGGILKVLERIDWLPIGPFTQYGWIIGLSLDVTLLSLALADDLGTARQEARRAAESAGRLKSFLPERVADLVTAGDRALLEPKRRDITVCVIDLRGFTPFSEVAAPEDIMTVLREFYDGMGRVVEQHGGTVEHFAGDSMLIFFNAPLEIPQPEQQAVQTALDMRAAFEPLRQKWLARGYELGLGIGIAEGYATIGAIGFSGRSQYAAIGPVSNLAARLCSLARHGEVLTTARVQVAVAPMVESEPAGEQAIKGFSTPVSVVRLLRSRSG